jgi:hypothetical protein
MMIYLSAGMTSKQTNWYFRFGICTDATHIRMFCADIEAYLANDSDGINKPLI